MLIYYVYILDCYTILVYFDADLYLLYCYIINTLYHYTISIYYWLFSHRRKSNLTLTKFHGIVCCPRSAKEGCHLPRNQPTTTMSGKVPERCWPLGCGGHRTINLWTEMQSRTIAQSVSGTSANINIRRGRTSDAGTVRWMRRALSYGLVKGLERSVAGFS